MEEPPAKVTKYEMESQYLEGEVMEEEGQEEWLSEGILTDDDYNPASQQTEPDHSDSNMVSQDDTMNTASEENSQGQLDSSAQYTDSNASNIEETLNNLENSQSNNQSSEFPEELNAFLIRKTDGKIIGGEAPKKDSDVDESVKQSDDDGNDTDDLLRVLGDGDQASKHMKKGKILIKRQPHEDSSDDDDDNYIFEGKKVKNFHVAETVLNRATASKAEPEDDITDCSSDEASTVRKMFTFKKSTTPSNTAPQIISTTVRPGNFTIMPLQTKKDSPKKTIIKKVVDVPVKKVVESPTKKVVNVPMKKAVDVPTKKAVDVPMKKVIDVHTKKVVDVPVKKVVEVPKKVVEVPKKVVEVPKKVDEQVDVPRKKLVDAPKKPSYTIKQEPISNQKPLEVKRPPTARYQYVNKRVQRSSSLLKPQPQTDKDKDEEDNDEPSRKNKATEKQDLMFPEEMDEEVPTDGESEDDSDEEDLYSEMPSSDSEVEDWFTLDIRAERAGDYIPLLGKKAYQLLSEEKRRVQTRLDTLKKSLAALSHSGRDVADQLREATKTVAELDAMLKVV